VKQGNHPALKSFLEFLKRIATKNLWIKILSLVLAFATYTALYDSSVKKSDIDTINKRSNNRPEEPMYKYFHNAPTPLSLIQNKPASVTNSVPKVSSPSTNPPNKEIKKK
jgi:hypothetical protein